MPVPVKKSVLPARSSAPPVPDVASRYDFDAFAAEFRPSRFKPLNRHRKWVDPDLDETVDELSLTVFYRDGMYCWSIGRSGGDVEYSRERFETSDDAMWDLFKAVNPDFIDWIGAWEEKG